MEFSRAVAIAAMLALSSPRLRAAIRRSRPGNANPAAREPAAAAHRPERGTAIPQPAARGAAEAAAAARGARRPASGGPAQHRGAAPVRRRRRPSAAGLSASASGYPQAQPGYDSRRSRRRRRSSRSRRGRPPAPGRRRGDAFDPSQNPNAPGAPQALGGGQLPIPARSAGRRARRPRAGRAARSRPTPAAAQSGGAAAAARAPGAGAALTTLPPSATPEGRVRSRHRLHAAQGLCARRRDHAQFRAEISERSADRRIRNTGSAKVSSSASTIATPRNPSSR